MGKVIFITFSLALICVPAFAADVTAPSSQFQMVTHEITLSNQRVQFIFRAIALAMTAVMGFRVWKIYKSSLTRKGKISRIAACILFSAFFLIAAFVEVDSCLSGQDPVTKALIKTACK